MSAPRVYFYDDPGAPVLSNAQDSFYQILRACLVDGYGAKPAAGWSVVYDDWAATGCASFTNASQNGVLGLVRSRTAGYQPFLFVADAMIDAQTPVNGRSGTAAVPASLADWPATTSGAYQRPCYQNSHFPAWCCIANDETAFFFMASSVNNLNVLNVEIDTYQASGMVVGSMQGVRGIGNPFAIYGGALGDQAHWNTTSLTPGGYVAGTVAKGFDGVTIASVVYPYLSNFSFGAYGFTPWRNADSVVNLRFDCAEYFYSANTSSGWRDYGYQIGVYPMLKTSPMFSRAKERNVSFDMASRIASRMLRDEISIDGKPHLLCRAPRNSYMLVSLAEEDWL